MSGDFLDRYSRLDSPVHRIPAGAKLPAALIVVGVLVVLPRAWAGWMSVMALFLLAVAVLSRVPWRFLLRRMLLLEPLVIGVAIFSLFQPDGVRIFLLLATRATLCLLTMLLLANTTPFSELLRVLRWLRVPALLITTLALMYRYLFVLMDQSQRMRRARASRTFQPHGRSWGLGAGLIGQLFIRSSERAERIYQAMCARGWQ